jgi:DnaK suppressor protein
LLAAWLEEEAGKLHAAVETARAREEEARADCKLDASDASEAEQTLLALGREVEAATERLEQIAKAQARLADGTYASCSNCNRSISRERLSVVPLTDLCSACAAPPQS